MVQHTKKGFNKYKDRCVELQNENEQMEKAIRRLKRNKEGLEALSKELSGNIVKHYVSESLASVLKSDGSDGAIHFTLDELQEVEEGLINKIQNCSEEHNHPLFKEYVIKYLEEKFKDAPKEEEDDKEDSDEEDDDDKDDDKEEDDDEDDDGDDDDQGGQAGGEADKDKEDDEEEEEQKEEPPQSKEVKIKRFNDKKSLQGKKHSVAESSSQHFSLNEVLQEGENAMYWKAVALKQMFGKWHLKTQLARQSAYMQKTFIQKFGTAAEANDEYPPKSEGIVQLVLAPSLQRIRSILPEKVNMFLTKAWIKKLQKEAEGQPRVTVALSYLEYLIRMQRDYEDMEKRYQIVRKQEFLQSTFNPDMHHYQLALLQEQAVELMRSWPKYNMHCEAKCQLPIHPSQVQIVDMTEGYRVSNEDLGNSPALRKLQTSTVSQMRVPLDLLFNPRPKWACLEDMRQEVKSLQAQFGINRNLFMERLQQYEVPAKNDIASQYAFMQYWIQHLECYQDMLEKENNFIIQYLLHIPDTPVCLYGIQPDDDALPHFFPVIYPFIQEPKDAEEYVQITDQLKVWRANFKMHYGLMKDMFKSLQSELDEGNVANSRMQELFDNINATFQTWTTLLQQLVNYCNNLLQINIVASFTTVTKKKTSTVEREVAELLMESRVYHQCPLADGWIATAERCMELAKARIHADEPGARRHEALLRQTLTDEEQRILLDEQKETMEKVQQRMPAPLIQTAGTHAKGKEKAVDLE